MVTNYYELAMQMADAMELTKEEQINLLGDLLCKAYTEGKISGLEIANKMAARAIKEVSGE